MVKTETPRLFKLASKYSDEDALHLIAKNHVGAAFMKGYSQAVDDCYRLLISRGDNKSKEVLKLKKILRKEFSLLVLV